MHFFFIINISTLTTDYSVSLLVEFAEEWWRIFFPSAITELFEKSFGCVVDGDLKWRVLCCLLCTECQVQVVLGLN